MPNMSLAKNPMPSQEPQVRNQNFAEVALGYSAEMAIDNVNTRLNYYGIAPLVFEKNELGGMTASLFTPKKITPKGSAQ